MSSWPSVLLKALRTFGTLEGVVAVLNPNLAPICHVYRVLLRPTKTILGECCSFRGGGGGGGGRQQPAHPQYANYWVPLTRKRHTMPHLAQPQHANYWAPPTRKRHQQEHRPQRPTESSDPTQHAKGRTGDRPGPRKGATTRRNVTQGGVVSMCNLSKMVGLSRQFFDYMLFPPPPPPPPCPPPPPPPTLRGDGPTSTTHRWTPPQTKDLLAPTVHNYWPVTCCWLPKVFRYILTCYYGLACSLKRQGHQSKSMNIALEMDAGYGAMFLHCAGHCGKGESLRLSDCWRTNRPQICTNPPPPPICTNFFTKKTPSKVGAFSW